MGDELSKHCTPTETHKSRKRRHCDWCYELIDIGEIYKRYRCYDDGDAQTVRMHPECCEAMAEAAREEGGWYEWTSGMERPEVVKDCG